MPTKRALVLVVLALALYLLANQTQVGWTYVMVDGLAGLLIVAFFYSLGMLKPVQLRRTFHNLSTGATRHVDTPLPTPAQPDGDMILRPPDFYEDEPIEVSLHLKHTALKPAFLINGQENCPFAPPADRAQPFFVPAVFKGQTLQLSYQTTCHRRGFYTFPAVKLRSKGPFSLFSTRRTLNVPGQILIYPQYYPLKRMRLLENKGFADRQALRVGAGSEVIGTREYRSGDSLRQIHWRSTARTGKLVVKEFTDHDQLTMAVVLDLSRQGSLGRGKFSAFETAIRLAASLGYYATHHDIPFRLMGHSPRWRPPAIALSWWGVLNYLAKVENDGEQPLAEVLRNLPPLPFVVVLVSHPTEAVGRELTALHKKGTQTVAIFITPNGKPPPAAPAPAEGLVVKTVDPHRWETVLEEL